VLLSVVLVSQRRRFWEPSVPKTLLSTGESG